MSEELNAQGTIKGSSDWFVPLGGSILRANMDNLPGLRDKSFFEVANSEISHIPLRNLIFSGREPKSSREMEQNSLIDIPTMPIFCVLRIEPKEIENLLFSIFFSKSMKVGPEFPFLSSLSMPTCLNCLFFELTPKCSLEDAQDFINSFLSKPAELTLFDSSKFLAQYCNFSRLYYIRPGIIAKFISPSQPSGDLCQIIGINYANGNVLIRILPRIDYKLLSQRKMASQRALFQIMPKGYNPPPVEFEPESIKAVGGIVRPISMTSPVALSGYTWDKSTFFGKFQFFETNCSQISTSNIDPSEKLLLTFAGSSEFDSIMNFRLNFEQSKSDILHSITSELRETLKFYSSNEECNNFIRIHPSDAAGPLCIIKDSEAFPIQIPISIKVDSVDTTPPAVPTTIPEDGRLKTKYKYYKSARAILTDEATMTNPWVKEKNQYKDFGLQASSSDVYLQTVSKFRMFDMISHNDAIGVILEIEPNMLKIQWTDNTISEISRNGKYEILEDVSATDYEGRKIVMKETISSKTSGNWAKVLRICTSSVFVSEKNSNGSKKFTWLPLFDIVHQSEDSKGSSVIGKSIMVKRAGEFIGPKLVASITDEGKIYYEEEGEKWKSEKFSNHKTTWFFSDEYGQLQIGAAKSSEDAKRKVNPNYQRFTQKRIVVRTMPDMKLAVIFEVTADHVVVRYLDGGQLSAKEVSVPIGSISPKEVEVGESVVVEGVNNTIHGSAVSIDGEKITVSPDRKQIGDAQYSKSEVFVVWRGKK